MTISYRQVCELLAGVDEGRWQPPFVSKMTKIGQLNIKAVFIYYFNTQLDICLVL